MPINPFKVVTEFRFEVGSAMLATDRLAGKTQQLSQAADDALLSFQKLGLGLVSQFSLGTGSIIGLLSSATRSSDSFRKSQLQLSSILASNKDNLVGPVDTFNERLMLSQTIMQDIRNTAAQFALPSSQLLQFTKLLSPILLKKGLAGDNLDSVIDIGRGVLKAAPILGVNPYDIEGQLMRAIEGQASTGDTFFNRLRVDTSAFKDIKGSKDFNSKTAKERVDLLTKALNEFANNADEVKAQTMTLSAQMGLLRDNLSGAFSILRPIGDAVLMPLVKSLSQFNKMLSKEGAAIAQSLGNILTRVFEDPRALIANLLQLRELSGDVSKSSSVMGFIGLGLALREIPIGLKKGGVAMRRFMGASALGGLPALLYKGGSAMQGFVSRIPFIGMRAGASLAALSGAALPLIGKLGRFLPMILKGLAFAFRTLFVPAAAVLTLFQLFSKAAAIAKIRDLEKLPTILPKVLNIFDRLTVAISNILSPITRLFNSIANLIAPLFSRSFVMEKTVGIFDGLVTGIEYLGKGMVYLQAVIGGLFTSIFQVFDNLFNGKFLGAFDGVGNAFDTGFNDYLELNGQNVVGPDGKASNQVTNIYGGVNIQNRFKENVEPDRIAFTIQEQFRKEVQNPRQSQGRFFNFGGALEGFE